MKVGRAKMLQKIVKLYVDAMCLTSKGEKNTIKLTFQKHSHNANPVTDQDNAEKVGELNFVFSCSTCTVAKHQGPYARNQNDRHWSPQTIDHLRLHIN